MATTTASFVLTAKSYIARVGDRVGSIPELPGPIAPRTLVTGQQRLVALAKATDAAFNEDPRVPSKNSVYRLFSQCRFDVSYDPKVGVSKVVASKLETDVGLEGPLRPPAMTVTPVTLKVETGHKVSFTWFGKGRPHKLAEPAFQIVRPRTSKYIWHRVGGVISVKNDDVHFDVFLTGSRFPSHRVFLDKKIVAYRKQDVFSALWTPAVGDNTAVA